MRMVYIFVSTLALIVNSSECSSHSAENHHSEHDPSRDRSSSPDSAHESVTILGHSLEELGYIRLIPRTNKGIQFEFRRYCFPVTNQLRLRADQNKRVPVPTKEQIVLSLCNGDVFAILNYSGFLSAIYRSDWRHKRVKINMMSSEVEDLTRDEIRDCPVGRNHPIFPENFNRTFDNEDSLKSIWNYHTEPQESASHRSRARSFPDRAIPDRALDCAIENLGYLRLIPSTNKNQIYEFRKYIFPSDKKIRIRIDNLTYSIRPNQEYLVLSTSNGLAFAIMDHDDILRGIYQTNIHNSRVKINMVSGEVDDLTSDEIRDCPVGKNNKICSSSYIHGFHNYDTLQYTWNSDSEDKPSSSSTERQHPPGRTTPQEPLPHPRSSSPPGRPPSDKVLGYSLARLGYIRLIPQANPNRRFQFRKYVILADRPIRLLLSNRLYVPVPVREHIVLSTSNGEVFAILEYTGILRGIYATNPGHSRVKINMISGAVESMTEIEKGDCHVGKNYPIFPRWFHKVSSNEDSLQRVY